jgi:hypothetical protein
MNAMRFACLLLAGAAMLGAQVVEGSVSNSVTRIGVSEVQVRLQRTMESNRAIGLPTEAQQVAEAQQEPYEALTDLSGKFRIEGVKDGKYNVTWFREGFSNGGTSVEVRAGDPLEVELRIAPLGRVTGRVLDGKGRPVADAKLELSGSSAFAAQQVAGENGEFAIENLGSGTYTLMACAPDEWDPPEPVDGKKQAWALTYYPGIVHADSAGRILVPPGGEVTGLEIKLLAVPVWRVSGVVVGADGKPVQAAGVSLSRGLGRQTNVSGITTDEDGQFELAATDGTYRVSVQATDEETTLHAESGVLVSGKDVSEVELRLTAPFKIHGKFSYDPPRPPDSKARASIFLTKETAPGAISMWNGEAEGNTFTLPAIYPGTYTLLASEPEPPYYLASVRVSGQDGMAGPVYLGAESDQAEIVFRAGGGTVSGNVEDCKGGLVEVIPVQEYLWRVLPKRDRCDALGHFTIQAVRPGDYYALSVGPGSEVPFALATLLPQATKVTVRAGETTRVDLKPVKLAVQ